MILIKMKPTTILRICAGIISIFAGIVPLPANTLLEEDFNEAGFFSSWNISAEAEHAFWLGQGNSRYMRFHPRFIGQYAETPVLYEPAGQQRLSFDWNQAMSGTADSVRVQVSQNESWETIYVIYNGNNRNWQTDTVSFVTGQDSFRLRWQYFTSGAFPSQYFNLENVRVESSPLTGIQLPGRLLDFQIYPNPNQGQFQVLINNPGRQAGNLGIFTAEGALLFQRPLPVVSRSLVQVDLPGLSKGIYFVRIETAASVFTQKIIIQ
jgi:Secretion system C-terminal sorting domain